MYVWAYEKVCGCMCYICVGVYKYDYVCITRPVCQCNYVPPAQVVGWMGWGGAPTCANLPRCRAVVTTRHQASSRQRRRVPASSRRDIIVLTCVVSSRPLCRRLIFGVGIGACECPTHVPPACTTVWVDLLGSAHQHTPDQGWHMWRTRTPGPAGHFVHTQLGNVGFTENVSKVPPKVCECAPHLPPRAT